MPDQQDDFSSVDYRSSRHNLKRQSLDVDNVSKMPLECKQLLEIFSPPLLACTNHNINRELCQNEVMNHPETLVSKMDRLWDVSIIEMISRWFLFNLCIHIAIHFLGNLEKWFYRNISRTKLANHAQFHSTIKRKWKE